MRDDPRVPCLRCIGLVAVALHLRLESFPMVKLITALVVCISFSAPAFAQQTFNPTRVSFQKSPDHAAQLGDGTELVAGYRSNTYLRGATAPIMSVDLCKPEPAANGTITVVMSSSPCPTGGLLFATPLVVNTTYELRISVYGPGGESAVSAPSNPFAFLGLPASVVGSPVVAR